MISAMSDTCKDSANSIQNNISKDMVMLAPYNPQSDDGNDDNDARIIIGDFPVQHIV